MWPRYIKHHHEYIVSLYNSISNTSEGGFSSLPTNVVSPSPRCWILLPLVCSKTHRWHCKKKKNRTHSLSWTHSTKHPPVSWTLRFCGAAARLWETGSPWGRATAACALPRRHQQARCVSLREVPSCYIKHRLLHLNHFIYTDVKYSSRQCAKELINSKKQNIFCLLNYNGSNNTGPCTAYSLRKHQSLLLMNHWACWQKYISVLE